MGSTAPAGRKETISIERDVLAGSAARSTSLNTTSSPVVDSYPRPISSYGTSAPSSEQTRLYCTRPPSLTWICRDGTFLLSVATYSATGMVTKPKEMVPRQTTRIVVSLRALPACTGVFADTFHYSRVLRKCHTRLRRKF